MVGDVEKLAAELELDRLRDREIAEDRRVEVDSAITAHDVDALIAEAELGGLGERRGVEPAVQRLLAVGQVRVAIDVGALRAGAVDEGVVHLRVHGERLAALEREDAAERPVADHRAQPVVGQVLLALANGDVVDAGHGEAVADVVAGRAPVVAAVVVIAEADVAAERAAVVVVVERAGPGVGAEDGVAVGEAPLDAGDGGVVAGVAEGRALDVDVRELREGPVGLGGRAVLGDGHGQLLRRDLVHREVAAGQLVAEVTDEADFGEDAVLQFALDAEIEHFRIAGAAAGFKKRDGGGGLRADADGAEAVVQRGALEGGVHAVAQVEGRGDAVIGRVEGGGEFVAERGGVGHAGIERVGEEDAQRAADDGFLVATRLPGEAEAGAEVVPIGVVDGVAPAVDAEELHDAGRAADGVDLRGVEGVGAVGGIAHGGVGFPADAEVEREVAGDVPIVLGEAGEVGGAAVERLGFAGGEAGGEAEQHGRETVAGGGGAGLAGGEQAEGEGAGGGGAIDFVVQRGPPFAAEFEAVLAADPADVIDDLILLNGELAAFLGGGAEGLEAGGGEVGEVAVGDAFQAQLGGPGLAAAEGDGVVDAVGVGHPEIVDDGGGDGAGPVAVEVVLMAESDGVGIGAGVEIDAGFVGVVGVVEIAAGEAVLGAEVVIDFGGVVVAGEAVDEVGAEVIGSGRAVGGAVGERVEGDDLEADRIEAGGGDAVAGEQGARQAAGDVLGGGGVVDGDQHVVVADGLREVPGALEGGGNGEGGDGAIAAAGAFVGEEKEGFVLDDRAAEGTAVDVVAERGFGLFAVDDGGEEVGRVELFVADVFEQGAVERVGTALGGGDDDAAVGAAVFGGVAVGHDLHFGYRLDRGIEIDLADAEAHVLAGAAIDPEHLRLLAGAGEGEVGFLAGVVADEDGGAGHLDEVEGAAVAEREVLDGLGFDELGDVGGASFEHGGGAGDGDRFADGADLHLYIEFEVLAGGEDEAAADEAAEAGLFGFDDVGADGELAEGEEAVDVSRVCDLLLGGGGGGGDDDAGDGGALRIADDAGDGGCGRLGERRAYGEENKDPVTRHAGDYIDVRGHFWTHFGCGQGFLGLHYGLPFALWAPGSEPVDRRRCWIFRLLLLRFLRRFRDFVCFQ